eukprot:TRINITY_DN67209_c4_g4_i1.p1 TRINITY_DN67209_c4_g4~~TRINITY_DN67209_c4_g4_i1.p1  ORF type:complete len:472 (-),score=43.96 TRINITY_DN67209_c4_g4_i1:482-1897(-)
MSDDVAIPIAKEVTPNTEEEAYEEDDDTTAVALSQFALAPASEVDIIPATDTPWLTPNTEEVLSAQTALPPLEECSDLEVEAPPVAQPMGQGPFAPKSSAPAYEGDDTTAVTLSGFALAPASEVDIVPATDAPWGADYVPSYSTTDVPAAYIHPDNDSNESAPSLSTFSLAPISEGFVPAATEEPWITHTNNYCDDLPPAVGGDVEFEFDFDFDTPQQQSSLLYNPTVVSSEFQSGKRWTYHHGSWVEETVLIKITEEYAGMGMFKVAMNAVLKDPTHAHETEVIVKLPHTNSGADGLSSEFINGQIQRDVIEQTQVRLLLQWLQSVRPDKFQNMDVVLPSIACLDSQPDTPFIIEQKLASFTKSYPPELCSLISGMQCLILKGTGNRWLIDDVQGQLTPDVLFSDVQLKSCVTDNQERNMDVWTNNIVPFGETHVCNCHCEKALQQEEVAQSKIWDQVMNVEQDTPFALN